MLSLLRNEDVSNASQNARSIYERNPKKPDYAATYALALHLQGRTEDGLAVFRKLSPEILHQPAIAGYYGLLLASSGQKDLAREFQQLGEKTAILPEEKALLRVNEK